MGAATAWWLARDGREVVLLERFGPGHTRGSSHGGSRIFRFAYPLPRYVRMAMLALPLWRELEADTGATLLETTGGIDHGDDIGVQAVAEALDNQGAAYEFLTAAAAAERWPGMRFDSDVLFQPDAGRCNADATVAALLEGAARHGAEVRFDDGAESVSLVHDDVAVRTAAGDEYRAGAAVVAAGAWLEKLAGDLVPLPPFQVTQEQVFHFAPADQDTVWPSFIHHRDPYIYGLETPGEGVKVAEHHAGAVVDPDTRSFEIDPAGELRVRDYVGTWFPGLDPWPVSSTTCLYTTTPTEDFHITRQGALVIVSACSGHGFKFTPLVGRMAADLVSAKG
ncbi:MAG: sarcosine oxidase [Actinomycetota bacterium]|nr:sarcosine oxidase [Actinomycetota bacterium]